jgi:ParB-like chromosome segregation protein Spo0J
MHPQTVEMRNVALGSLGERLSALRLCAPSMLATVRCSLAQHGQLSALTVFAAGDGLEIVDGFKRMRAARALGWPTLLVRVDEVDSIEAKLRLYALHDRGGLCELEEGWLVRALYRDDGLSQPEIARRMSRHKSWVFRRLMLVEALEPALQADVRLGLLAPRAAVAVSRLPRGNQLAAAAVVERRALTFRQTELLVEEALSERELDVRAALLTRRLDEPGPSTKPTTRPTRALRNEADWMSADILKVHELAARLSARLGATPLEALAPAAAELLHDALLRLLPVLRALAALIGAVTAVTGDKDIA